MIKSIAIEHFRGIPSLTLDELTPLVVLVGPNGCGKSTVLDAMLLGAAPEPAKALRYVVERRAEQSAGARWLFPRGEASRKTKISVDLGQGAIHVTRLELPIGATLDYDAKQIRIGATLGGELSAAREGRFDTIFRSGAAPELVYDLTVPDNPPIRIIEPRPGSHHADLPRVHAEAFKAGLLDQVVQLLAEVVPGVTALQTLTEADGSNVVYLGFKDGAIPVGVAGDGILALTRLAFELALPAGGTALIEEPEVHQHPQSERLSARAIVAAVRRGVQVVLSTHSLELIDDLLYTLSEPELALFSLYMMAKNRGEVVAVRRPGAEARSLRDTIGDDFR